MKQKLQNIIKLLKENRQKTVLVVFAILCLCASAFYGIYRARAKNLIALEVSYNHINTPKLENANNVQDAIDLLYKFGQNPNGPAPTVDPKYYLVQFECNYTGCENTVTSQGILSGHTIDSTEPNSLTREHYGLGGWYTNAACTNEFDLDTPVTEDTVLYAKWNLDTYTVTFDTRGGTPLIESIDVPYGYTISSIPTITKENYTFGGWYTNSDLTNPFDISSQITSNLNLYAKWTNGDLVFDNQSFTVLYSETDSIRNITAPSGGSGTYTYTKLSGGDNEITIVNGNQIKIAGGTRPKSDGSNYTINIRATDSVTGAHADATYSINIGKIGSSVQCENKVYNGSSQRIGTCTGGPVQNNMQTDAGNYTVSCQETETYSPASTTCRIDKADNDVTIHSNNHVYDGNAVTATATDTAHTGAINIDYYSDSSCLGTKITTPIKDIGTYYGQAIVPATSNYKEGDSGCKLAITITEKTQFNITFDAVSYGANSNPASITNQTVGTRVTLPTVTSTRDGFVFKGWSTTPNSHSATYTENELEMPATDLELHAVFEKKNAFSLEFKDNGDAKISGEKYSTCNLYNSENTCNISITTPTISRPGYTILGFNTLPDSQTSEFGSGISKTITLENNVIYYPITYHEVTMNFIANGNTINSSTQSCTLWNTDIICHITTPSITGTTNTPNVIGFQKNSSYSTSAKILEQNKPIEVNFYGYDNSTNWYAHSRSNVFSLNAEYIKGNGIKAIDVRPENKICQTYPTYNGVAPNTSCQVRMPNIAGEDGVEAVKWTSSTNSYKVGEYVTIRSNTTFTAVGDIKKYTISFETNGGSSISNQTVNHNGKVSYPNDPSKPGYLLDGWYTDKDFKSKYNFDNQVRSSFTLYAKWIVDAESNQKFQVLFQTNGGSPIPSIQSVLKGGKATKPTQNPSKEGYTFKGWYTDDTYKIEFDFNTPIYRKTVVYAWMEKNPEAPKKYKVVFATGGGTAIDDQDVIEGETATRPENPTKPGYTFGGWFTNSKFETPYTFEEPVTSSIVIYAKFDSDPDYSGTPDTSRTIIFDTDGGTSINPQQVDVGGHPTTPTNPTKDGYTFNGWTKEGNPIDPNNYEVLDTDDPYITFKANWTEDSSGGGGSGGGGGGGEVSPAENIFTVLFDSDGGSDVEGQIVKEGERVTEPEEPTKKGYTFVAWYRDVDLIQKYDFNKIVTSNMILHAKYKKNKSSNNSSDKSSDKNSNNNKNNSNNKNNNNKSEKSNIKDNGNGTKTITSKTDDGSKITVRNDDDKDNKIQDFQRKEVSSDDKDKIKMLFPDALDVTGYDLTALDKDEKAIDMGDKEITYKLKLPLGYLETDNLKLYRIINDRAEEINFTTKDGYIEFTMKGTGRVVLVKMPKKELMDENDTGISVRLNDDLYTLVDKFKVKKITGDDKKKLKEKNFDEALDLFAFSTSLYDSNGDLFDASEYPLTYVVPLPDGLSEFDNLFVYSIKNGKKKKIKFDLVDGNVEFTTDGTGTYAVVKYSDDYVEGDTTTIKKKGRFPWWIILIILAVGGGTFFGVKKIKNKNKI